MGGPSMIEIAWAGDPDAEILRNDGYTYWPPKAPKESQEPIEDYQWYAAPPPPTRIIDGPQMIMVGNMPNRNGCNVLMVQLGPATPFTDSWLTFADEYSAQWNPIFNFWQIALKNRTMNSAIKESWAIIQDALLMCDWEHRIEFQLRWGQINQSEVNAYGKFTKAMNNFWVGGDMPFIQEGRALVHPLDPLGVVLNKALAHATSRGVRNISHSQWAKCCVNYLRHRCSAYDSRLRLLPGGEQKTLKEFQVFRETNNAIAQAYPELSHEVNRQNKRKWKIKMPT